MQSNLMFPSIFLAGMKFMRYTSNDWQIKLEIHRPQLSLFRFLIEYPIEAESEIFLLLVLQHNHTNCLNNQIHMHTRTHTNSNC
jgi:hypothetical protein